MSDSDYDPSPDPVQTNHHNSNHSLFESLSLHEQQRLLQHFLQQQDARMANELQNYMLAQTKKDKDAKESMDDEKQSSRWQQSHKYVRNFDGKWLYRLCLRPMNVHFSFNTMASRHSRAASKYLRPFNNLRMNYSAIEITLLDKQHAYGDYVRERYLIFPDFCHIFSTHLFNDGLANWLTDGIFSAQICTNIMCQDAEWVHTMYRNNYGEIRTVSITDADDIQLTMSNEDIWAKHIFSDELFLDACIVPYDILRIILVEYADTHNDSSQIQIEHPCKRTGKSFDYNWVCHKLEGRISDHSRKQRMECIDYQFAGKVMGKYVNATIDVQAGWYGRGDGGGRYLAALRDDHCGKDEISSRLNIRVPRKH